MNTPHKHKDVIIAYANGAEIQTFHSHTGWVTHENPRFYAGSEYRIKPEREWPVTSLSADELSIIFTKTEHWQHPYVNIANAAIKQYIIDSEK